MEDFSARDLAQAGGPGRISAIDAMRALAMTAVVAEHSKLLSFGWSGVWLFYVISGFVVTGTLMKGRATETAGRALGNFYARRALRIVPIYALVVAIGFLATLASGGPARIDTLASLVFFYNNFALAAGYGNFPAFDVGNLWTISVEMQFYAMYGLLFILCERRLVVLLLMALIVLCPFGRWLYGSYLLARHVAPDQAAFAIYSSSILQFDAFAAGCLLALYRARLSMKVAWRLIAAGVAAMTSYCMTYVLVNIAHGDRGVAIFRNVISGILFGQHREVFVYMPFVILAAGLVCLVVVRPPPNLKLLTVLAAIGEISYGGYIYHVTILRWAGFLGSLLHPSGAAVFLVRGAVFAVAMTLTISLAWLSYKNLERPLISFGGRLLRGRGPDPATRLA